jgi:hypothetical protein
MAADANMTPMDSENADEMTGKTTGNITSYTSGVSNQSPLTMLEFSDIESDNEEIEMVSNKRKFVIVRSDDDEKDVEEEENDYADLDEEVLNVMLGLKNNMTLDKPVFRSCNQKICGCSLVVRCFKLREHCLLVRFRAQDCSSRVDTMCQSTISLKKTKI